MSAFFFNAAYSSFPHPFLYINYFNVMEVMKAQSQITELAVLIEKLKDSNR